MDEIKPHDIIYLQWEEFDSGEGVTWCKDSINDNDIIYIKHSIYDAKIKKLRDALERAKQFIENGVEYGYIKLPDSEDPALDTLPIIKKALEDSETINTGMGNDTTGVNGGA